MSKWFRLIETFYWTSNKNIKEGKYNLSKGAKRTVCLYLSIFKYIVHKACTSSTCFTSYCLEPKHPTLSQYGLVYLLLFNFLLTGAFSSWSVKRIKARALVTYYYYYLSISWAWIGSVLKSNTFFFSFFTLDGSFFVMKTINTVF